MTRISKKDWIIITIAVIIICFVPFVKVYRAGGIPFMADESIKCELQVCWYPVKVTLWKYKLIRWNNYNNQYRFDAPY
jgi:hypothetical protein